MQFNIFEKLARAPLEKDAIKDELKRYLSDKREQVVDAVEWWYARRKTYPRLSRMALDYLTIPGTYLFLSCFLFYLLTLRVTFSYVC